MKKIITWIKENWKDPVWSKVFGGIILSTLVGVVTLIVSLFNKIPLKNIYEKSIDSYIQINYFSLVVILIITLALLIPAIYMDIIHIQYKHLKFPKNLNSPKLDLQKFLIGDWFLTYTHTASGPNGSEPVTILNGNQYYIGKQLSYFLTDIQFDEKTKELKWTKIRFENNQKHSSEILKLIDDNTINGSDNLGYVINYVKVAKATNPAS